MCSGTVRRSRKIPQLLPGWRFIQAVRPVCNAVGVFFGILLVLAAVLFLAAGCFGPTDTGSETPGISVWLGEDGMPKRTAHNPGLPGEPIVVRVYDHTGKLAEEEEFKNFNDVIRLLPQEVRDMAPEVARKMAETGRMPLEALEAIGASANEDVAK